MADDAKQAHERYLRLQQLMQQRTKAEHSGAISAEAIDAARKRNQDFLAFAKRMTSGAGVKAESAHRSRRVPDPRVFGTKGA